MAEEKKERDWSIVFAITVVGVPVLLFIALDWTVLPYWKSGTVEEARLVSTPDGDRIFLLESVSDGEDSTLERLTMLDPANLNAKPLRTWTRDDVRFAGFAGGRLWFSSHHADPGWHTRDPRTLEVTMTQAELARADSRLRRIHSGEFKGDALELSTLDGFELRVDAETLAITEKPKADGRYVGGRSREERDIETSYETLLPDGSKLRFEGQPRVSIVRDGTVLGTETFLHPKLLQPRRGEGPFVLSDPQSVLIAHRKTVEYDSALSISRVSTEDGRVLWTRGLGGEKRLEEVAVTGDFVVIVAYETVRSIFARDGSVAALVDL